MDDLFENNLPNTEDAKIILDLCDMNKEQALTELEKTFDERESGEDSLFVFFEPATENSGETLFPTVGNYIRENKKSGIVSHSYPVMQDNTAGFFVVFKDAS